MKKFWFFLIGILTGVALTILGAYIINKAKSSDIAFFDEPGDVVTAQTFSGRTITVNGFEVFQVLGEGVALARGNELYTWDLIVLLWDDKGEQYYDNQSVIAPIGKCFRQIGIYKYESKDESYRTVPVVTLMDSEINYDENVQSKQQTSTNGMTFFDEPGEVMSDKSYKISRVVSDGAALARGKSEYGSLYYGLEVLLWDEKASFYDDQIVKAPNGKCFRQIGIYKNGFSTYPIVTLKDGNSGGQKSELNRTTQKVDKTLSKSIDRNKVSEPQISTEPTKTETSNPKLDKNKAYRLVKD